MNIRYIHSWSMEPNQAIALQNKLASQLVLHTRIANPRLIAGVDVSFPSRATALAVVVVLEFSTLQVVDCFHAIGKVDTPYIPGLLSFREGPTILNALSKSSEVDLLFFDGHGIAHPRGIGIASHIGLFLETPTIGVAKKLLYGRLHSTPMDKGKKSPITAPDGRLLGYALCTRQGVKPVYVSPGNRITPELSVEMVLKTTDKYRIPEPTRQAHIMTQKLKDQLSL